MIDPTSLLRALPHAVITTAPDGTITFWNEAAERLYGWKAAEVLGRSIASVTPTDDSAIDAAEILNHLREGKTWSGAFRVQRRDGSRFLALVSDSPQFGEDGELVGIIGVSIALADFPSAQIAAEAQRLSKELLIASPEAADEPSGPGEQLRQALLTAQVAPWEFDLRSGIARSEELPRALELPGMPVELTIDAALDLIHPADREHVQEKLSRAAEAGEDFDTEFRLRMPDGTERVLHTRGSVERDERGTTVRIVGVAQNVTERKRLEERLQQAERVSSLGRLAASVAHEFNNVLMGIQPFAELIVRRSDHDGRLHSAAVQIADGVARGKRITQDILRFTRTPDPVRQVVNVRTWLAQCEEEMRQLAGPRVQLIVGEMPDANMLADPHQMRQVFANLIVNARDAMPRGGDVFIAADTEPGFVHFTVRDTGVGMSAETLRLIFEPLFTTKKNGGTGLGLAVVHQVLQRHGGEIWAESVETNGGATFHLRVPSTLEARRDSAPAPESDRRAPFGLITIVEDDECVAAGLATILELDGVHVDVVRLGAQAVPQIERNMPDAVVLDIGLPDIDGLTVYHAIASRWPSLPVVFSTGHGDEKLLTDILGRANVSYLQKPYETEALIAELNKLRAAAGG